VTALRDERPEIEGDRNLTGVVAELRALRTASQTRRYRGSPPPLPSREIIIEIVEGLVSALYPRHFGPADLAPADADAFVIRTLESALAALKR
jgi:serine O-acetyltransferase